MRSAKRKDSCRRYAARSIHLRKKKRGSCHSPSGWRRDSRDLCRRSFDSAKNSRDPRRRSFDSAKGSRDPRQRSFDSAKGSRDLGRRSFDSVTGSRDPRRKCCGSAADSRDPHRNRCDRKTNIAVRNPILCRKADWRGQRRSVPGWRNRRFFRIPDDFDCYSCPCEFSPRAQTRIRAAGASIFCIIIAFETNNFVVIL